MNINCEFCTVYYDPERETCPSCALYDAAVRAQQVAAQNIACRQHSRATRAWLNEYGVFAFIDGISMQVGTPEEAAPFVALTSAARRVTEFQRSPLVAPEEERDTTQDKETNR